MAELKITLLGTPRIKLNGELVSTDRRKAVALLAYLTVTAVPHSRESLAALFWPESDQSRAFAYLRRTLWEINQMVGEGWLQTSRETVVASEMAGMKALWLDTAVFAQQIVSHEKETLTAAAELVQGEFMAGFSLRDAPEFDTWQLAEREKMRRAFGGGLQKLVDLYAADEAWETAVTHAQRWLKLDTLDEAPQRALMCLYALSGQRAAALTQYESCVSVLAEELDVLPEPATVALCEAIKRGDLSSQFRVNSPIKVQESEPDITYNLPEQPTPFVGRAPELAEITHLLKRPETRLLTLVGQGGSGKTRLAVETAQRIANQESTLFPDGIFFVPLGWLDAPDSVLAAVAYTLNFHFYDDENTPPQKQLVTYLSSKQMLLVMDNYEHLLEVPGLDLLIALLAQASGVKILATSRVRLNVRGEQIYQVAGMRWPQKETAVSWQDPQSVHQYSAVRLFCQQAKRNQVDFELTAENGADVVRICQLVDGLPLGIELAVAWLPMLSPAEIVAEIERNLDFLSSEQQDVPQRQRSLRAVFEYSWNLLSAEEQAVYQKLSIFRGSFSREAAQGVADASLHDLMILFNKSLLWRDGNGRFQLHELLRQYASERLAADAEQYKQVTIQFSRFFLEFVKIQTEIMKSPAQKSAFDTIEAEEENVKQAWLWAVKHQIYQPAREVMNGLLIFYMARSLYRELNVILKAGLDLIETAVSQSKDDRQTQLMHIAIMSYLGWTASDEFDEYVKYFPNNLAEQAMSLVQKLEAQAELGLGYVMLCSVYTWNVDREVGLQYFRESVEMIRASGDQHMLAVSLSVLGGTLTSLNHWQEARKLLAEAIQLNRQLNNRFLLAISLQTLGYAEGISRNYERAFQIYEECQGIYLDLYVLRGAASIHFDMGDVSALMGQYRQGIDWLVSARELYEKCGDKNRVAGTYSWQSMMAMRLGEMETAVAFRQDATQLYEQIQDRSGLAWSLWEAGELSRVQKKYEEARQKFRKSLPAFQALHDTWGEAYVYRGLGETALREGELDTALAHFQHSLTGLEKEYHPWGDSYLRAAMSEVYTTQGNLSDARQNLQTAVAGSLTQGDKGLILYVFASVANYLEVAGEIFAGTSLAAFVSTHIATWWETRQRTQLLLATFESDLSEAEMQAAFAEHQLVSLEEMVEVVQQLLNNT